MTRCPRWRQWALRLYRLAVLVGIFTVVHAHHDALRARTERPITLREVRAFLPDAAELGAAVDPTAAIPGLPVTDAAGARLGTALRTSPVADEVIGYSGPADTMIVLGADGRVVGARLLRSDDTPGHVEDVVADERFWRTWNGVHWTDVAGSDPERIEGVSGATRTSRCVAEGVVRRLAHAVRASERDPGARGLLGLRLGVHDAVLLTIVLAAVALAWHRGLRRGAFRRVFQVAVFGYLGLYAGELIAQSLLAGWAQSGVPWRFAPGLVLLVAAALCVPWSTGRPFYCAHVCPHGIAQEWLGRVRRRKWRLPASVRRFAETVPTLLLIVVVCVVALAVPLDLAGIEAFDAYVIAGAGTAALVIALAGLALAPFVPMAYCRYGCPTGAVLGFVRSRGDADRFGVRDGVAALLLALSAVLCAGHDTVRAWLADAPRLPGPLGRVQREELAGRTLAALRVGLDAHRARTDRFPTESPIAASELVRLLRATGDLRSAPVNPDTAEPYGAVDLELDRIWYTADSGGTTFVLEVLAADREDVVRVTTGSAR